MQIIKRIVEHCHRCGGCVRKEADGEKICILCGSK